MLDDLRGDIPRTMLDRPGRRVSEDVLTDTMDVDALLPACPSGGPCCHLSEKSLAVGNAGLRVACNRLSRGSLVLEGDDAQLVSARHVRLCGHEDRALDGRRGRAPAPSPQLPLRREQPV